MSPALLTLNAGSSSIKFAIFEPSPSGEDPRLLLRGHLAGIGRAPRFTAQSATGETLATAPPTRIVGSHASALSAILDWLDDRLGGFELVGAGHRVVHGGRGRTQPARVTRELLVELHGLEPLAPHHQPHNLAAIHALGERAPDIPQVACFDTAFHAGQPEIASLLPLPGEYRERGLQRYGFHGLSYEYIAHALPGYIGGLLPPRLIVAHLGNGSSACAIEGGRSIATTMGFSTLDGLVMGTRCGAIDPGVLLYLIREEGMDEERLTDLLYNRCGLLGVSGVSAEMHVLLASDDPAASRAVALFCYTLTRTIGSLAAALRGLDALVFTGGIGERGAAVRAQVCRDLAWLGLELDEVANNTHGPGITLPTSRVSAWVIPTNEEQIIARHTQELLFSAGASHRYDSDHADAKIAGA